MGALSVPTSGLVYVDANTVIYAVERIEPYCTLLEPVWQRRTNGKSHLSPVNLRG
jgi:hypothetical protein